jgi:hypothetical protein
MKLFAGEESRQLLEKAKAARAQYAPPGAREPAAGR